MAQVTTCGHSVEIVPHGSNNGRGRMVIDSSAVETSPVRVTSRFTEYVPAEVNTWLGFCATAVKPSPKSHDQLSG